MGKFRDWILLLLCNLIWGSQPTMVKLVQSKMGPEMGPEMGPVFATFFPIAIAAMLLFPIVLWERRKNSATKSRITRKDIRDFIFLGVFGQVVAQLLITWGTGPGWSPAANTSLLFLALPVCTCVMAYFILGERLTRLRLLSFVLAMSGVIACSIADFKGLSLTSGKVFWGSVLVFLSVNGSAFYNVYSKKVLVRYSPLQVLLYSYYAMLAFTLPILVVVEPHGISDLPHYGLKVWCGLLILAFFVYALAMVIFLSVLSRLDATQAGLSNYLFPFFSLLIAHIVFKEELTLPMIFGGLLVLGSTLLITVYEEFRNAREADVLVEDK